MSIFFTADNHFFHKNMINYEDRPFKSNEEMTEVMIEKWNNKVGKYDSIYILGDFAFGKSYEVKTLLDKLNGHKFLIKGNHDYYIKDKLIEKEFIWVKDYYMLKHNNMKFILFHYPIYVWDCKHHGSIHLYGHVHSNKDNYHPLLIELGKAYNVGVDVNNYEPVSLEEVLDKFNN